MYTRRIQAWYKTILSWLNKKDLGCLYAYYYFPKPGQLKRNNIMTWELGGLGHIHNKEPFFIAYHAMRQVYDAFTKTKCVLLQELAIDSPIK